MLTLGSISISETAKKLVHLALDSGHVAQGGGYVQFFEEHFAARLGRKHCVATSSGTMAVAVALAAMRNLRNSPDTAQLRADTFIATANAARMAGFTKLGFYDVDEMLPQTGLRVLTPVLGIAGDPPPPGTVEDACEALGSRYSDGTLVGSNGADASCFSFFITHSVSSGEGGAVVTDDDYLAAEMRGLRDHGRSGTMPYVLYDRPGFNAKMTSLEAIIADDQLEHLDEYVDVRRALAETYDDLLGEHWLPAGTCPHAYPIDCETKAARDVTLNLLLATGVESRPYFPCLPISTWCREYVRIDHDWPEARRRARSWLYVPCREGMTVQDIERIVGVIEGVRIGTPVSA